MSLGGLIPIGGGGGKKANASSDLTSGLISIAGSKASSGGGGLGDLDMSDFDVDDLLADNVGGASKRSISKSKSKSKPASLSPSKDSSSKKKKSSSSKSKDKDKSSNSGSKKTSKSKTKDSSLSAFDDSADNFDDTADDWGGSNKAKAKSKWGDDSSEFALSVPPVKKKGVLDAEFAKMLGLDDDDFGVSAASASGDANDSDHHERSAPRGSNRDDGGSERVSNVSGFGSRADESELSAFSYEPRVRGGIARGTGGREKPTDVIGSDLFDGASKRDYSDPFASKSGSISAQNANEGGSKRADTDGGLSALFFQSETSRVDRDGDDGDAFGASSLSFLSSTTGERRGGRGGRRGGASATPTVDDPFASAGSVRGSSDLFGGARDSSAAKLSALDPLFDGSSRTKTRESDGDGDNSSAGGFGTKSRGEDPDAAVEHSATGSRRGGARGNRLQTTDGDDLLTELFPSEPAASMSQSKSLAAKPASLGNAKDDLLAELFPSKPSTSTSRIAKPEQRSPEPSKVPAPVSATSLDGTVKDDILADLLPPGSQAPKPSRRRVADVDSSDAKQQDDLLAELFPTTTAAKPTAAKPGRVTSGVSFDDRRPERDSGASKPAKVAASKPAGLDDISSARDSLLMDLFPESPPKLAAVEPRRRSITPTPSPAKEPPPPPSSPSLVKQAAETDPDASYATSSPLRRPSTSPQRSPLRVDEPSPTRRNSNSFVSATVAAAASEPPVSPGRAKTLASPSASSIKEVDFEQSKDSLLEELLSPAKSPPVSPSGARGAGTHRRNSYSQSFDHGNDDDDGQDGQDGRRDGGADSPQRRRRKLSEASLSSPSPSPEKAATSGTSKAPEPTPALSPQDASPPRNTSKRQQYHVAPATSSHAEPTSAESAAAAEQYARELAAALQQREHELRTESDALRAALAATHESELARLNRLIEELTQQLGDERAKREVLETERTQFHVSATLAEQQCALLQQQSATLQRERLELQQELHTLRAQHAGCEPQRALFESERAGFVTQVQALEAQTRALVLQLSAAKQETQAAQLAFASFKHEAQQDACLQTQREAHQMRQLHAQLQTSLVSLKMLQEQVADDERTQHEVESGARLRMITALETSSRQCARTAEDECVRLTSLLSNLETTLRHARQEHLEEKERLRQEQQRLSVLASHFQAQTSVLHESAENNTQLLAQHFTASMQDVRVAEARLAARRQALDDAERTLYDDRTRFAVYREEWLAQQARDVQALQRDQQQLDAKWRALQRERDDLDAVIASHEDDFAALQHDARALEHERERIERRAQQVGDTAAALETLTRELLAREDALTRERDDMARAQRECAAQLQGVASDKHKLDERELRLHTQLKQMEQARRRLNDQRKHHLAARGGAKAPAAHAANPLAVHDLEQARQRLLAFTRYMGANSGGGGASIATVAAPVVVDNNRKWRTPASNSVRTSHVSVSTAPPPPGVVRHGNSSACASVPSNNEPSDWHDPSGLSPTFRQLVEDNWRQREQRSGIADAALHKERMWISCIGLDTTPVRGANDGVKVASDGDNTKQQQRRATVAALASDNNRSTSSLRVASAAAPDIPSRSAGARPPPPPPHSIASAKRTVTIDL